jgi:hypothetical protein
MSVENDRAFFIIKQLIQALPTQVSNSGVHWPIYMSAVSA